MKVNDVEVIIEGAGPKVIVMIHGWPDTYRLWDAQVDALKAGYRCVRFTLPGFDRSAPRRAYSFAELLEILRRVVEETSPGKRVILLLHDWGCFFGYQLAMRHPELVERIIGVDIGDAGSRENRAELGFRGMTIVLVYQLWLALAWKIGGRLGDGMARWMARTMRCPTDPCTIGAHMGYPYAMRWLGAGGGLQGVKVFAPQCPLLFLYGKRKPVMFHSRRWAERVAAQPGSRVVEFDTGHWIMVQRPRELNQALLGWLAS